MGEESLKEFRRTLFSHSYAQKYHFLKFPFKQTKRGRSCVLLDLNDTVVKIGRVFNTRRNIVSYRNDVKRHNVVPLDYFLHLRLNMIQDSATMEISEKNMRHRSNRLFAALSRGALLVICFTLDCLFLHGNWSTDSI
jgi:hypothetical protein